MKNSLISKIISNYRYTDSDALAIKEISEHILLCTKEFSTELHKYVLTFEHARAFIKTKEELAYHKLKIEKWFSMLFTGVYNNDYYDYLYLINSLHKRIGLPPNYINSTFTFIRRFIRSKLLEAGKVQYVDAVEKILDLNLELLSTHYVGEDFEETLGMIRLLRESLDNDYIVPYVQEIVSAETMETASYECLCRIEHPENGVISPACFLEIAKQVDLYHDISKVMCDKSFDKFKAIKAAFSLNLSFLDISDIKTADYIKNMISNFGMSENIIIEVVETEELSDNDMILSFCSDLKKFGALIAIDDFGAGFSNFNNINKLKPDFIKIDGSLIKDIDSNIVSRAAVESIVTMAKKLGIMTVAEYVHSEAILNICRELRIDKLQGFYISKPVSINSLVLK